jgi:hypothetical protein
MTMKAWLKFHVGQLLRFVEVAGGDRGDRVAGKLCRTIAAGCNMGKVSRRSPHQGLLWRSFN